MWRVSLVRSFLALVWLLLHRMPPPLLCRPHPRRLNRVVPPRVEVGVFPLANQQLRRKVKTFSEMALISSGMEQTSKKTDLISKEMAATSSRVESTAPKPPKILKSLILPNLNPCVIKKWSSNNSSSNSVWPARQNKWPSSSKAR